MSEYMSTIEWSLDGSNFSTNRYSRRHRWLFDGSISVPASSSPQIVPLPMSDAAAVDPEEAFVASLSSCHMLWFLFIAAQSGYVIETYRDHATGVMSKGKDGKLAMTLITLRPVARFSTDKQPNDAELHALHASAHESCYIAASIRTEVRCEPSLDINQGINR